MSTMMHSTSGHAGALWTTAACRLLLPLVALVVGAGCSGGLVDDSLAMGDDAAVDGSRCKSQGTCNEGFLVDDVGVVASDGFAGSGGSGGSSGSGADACASLDVRPQRLIPTVVLLVDRSGSMNEDFGTGTRWSVLHDALMAPKTGVVDRMQSQVRFGLTTYTSKNGSAGGTCPMLTEVAPKLQNFSAIEQVYGTAAPIGDTPTGESITATAAKLLASKDEGPKIILLVTDGLPDSCAVPNPRNGTSQETVNGETVRATQDAFANGVRTLIMGVSTAIAPTHLQAMANAGAGLAATTSTPATYYVARSDQASLATQLAGIIGSVQTCTFTLNGRVEVGRASEGRVVLNGRALSFGDANGWKLQDDGQLEILGSACVELKGGSAPTLQASFPCGVFVPIQ